MVIQARINNGQFELSQPIPSEWEGIVVTIAPATPDDPYPDIEATLAALHALGPMEYEPGEQDQIEAALKEMDALGRAEMEHIAGLKT